MTRSLLACLLVAATPTIALADVVDPEPTDCPSGTVGRTCHGGPFCGPETCTMDSECSGGDACVERSLCIVRRDCGGLRPPDADPAAFEVDQVEGSCPGSCGGECRTIRVCAGSGGGSDDGGCCSTAPGRPADTRVLVSLLLGAVGLTAAAVAHRRRRRSR